MPNSLITQFFIGLTPSTHEKDLLKAARLARDLLMAFPEVKILQKKLAALNKQVGDNPSPAINFTRRDLESKLAKAKIEFLRIWFEVSVLAMIYEGPPEGILQ